MDDRGFTLGYRPALVLFYIANWAGLLVAATFAVSRGSYYALERSALAFKAMLRPGRSRDISPLDALAGRVAAERANG